jgi:hypothetical protein
MENGKKSAFGFGYANVEIEGLTKREYFAGLAMQGLISSKFCVNQTILVENAILFADEILKQLED